MSRGFLIFMIGTGIILMSQRCSSSSETVISEKKQDAALKTSIKSVDTKAQEVVDKAIIAHGADKFEHASIEFDFRGRHYTSKRDGGIFLYQRIFQDTIDGSPVVVRDELRNDSFQRFIDDRESTVDPKKSFAYSNSVNSVLYFIQQPYFLNDPAVNKEYLGESVLQGQSYHKIKITFGKKRGGKDYEDVFVYWFSKEKLTMDYFAYSYETDGGGLRFREAYNVNIIEGIRFADYVNYEAEFEKFEVEDLDSLYNLGLLRELSRIENFNIQVSLISF